MHCQHAESGRCSGAGPTGREGQALVGLGERGVGFARRMWNGGAQSDKGWIRHDESKHAHVHTHTRTGLHAKIVSDDDGVDVGDDGEWKMGGFR